MTDEFAGCHSRLDRVQAERDRLNRTILDTLNPPQKQARPYRVWFERDANTEDEFAIRMEQTDALPADWAVVVGEMIHNLRAALDNLVWRLAELNTNTTPPWPIPYKGPWRKVQFPVYSTPRRFDDGTKMWRHLLAPEDWTILEKLQPYEGGRSYRDDHLWMLDELSSAGKHRTMPLVAMFNSQLIGPPVIARPVRDVEIARIETVDRGICRGQTELGRMKLHATGPEPQVEVNEQFTFEVGVDHPAVAAWPIDAMMLITVFMSDVQGIVDTFDARYP